jgi:hypothetical protein
MRPVVVADRLPVDRRQRAHAAVARGLPRGANGRLLHLLLSEDGAHGPEVALEACALAERVASAGQLGRAITVLEQSLSALRRGTPVGEPCADLETPIFAVWIKVVLTEGTPRSADRLLYELCRVPYARTAILAELEDLTRAALGLASDPLRVLATVSCLPPFDDIELERRRLQVRIAAARRCGVAREAELLVELEPWASGHLPPADALGCAAVRDGRILGELEPTSSRRLALARASYDGWLGWLRYREGRFVEAASHHMRAAEGEPWLTLRLAAILNAASALMEAFQNDEAAGLVRAALAMAAEARQPYYEARAEWLRRTIEFRREQPLEVDHELVEAVEILGVGDVEALVCLTEAAIARRTRQMELARGLAERAHFLWASTRWETGAILARCLAVACGSLAKSGELQELAERAATCELWSRAHGAPRRCAPALRRARSARAALPVGRRSGRARSRPPWP